MSELDDVISLLCGTVGRAGTLQCLQAADEEFQFNPIRAQFHGKHMGPAVGVFELDITEQIVRDRDPENLIQISRDGSFFKEAIDFFHI